MKDFENFLIDRNDSIDNSAYELIQSLASDEIEWDIEIIGEVVELVEEYLVKKDINICHPYYEGGENIPCSNGFDCKNKKCYFCNK